MGEWALGKWASGLFSALMIGVVSAPVVENWRDEPRDSFPLSYYPMFSYRRAPTASVTYMVGIDADGNRRNLHYRYAAGGGMNQVRKQIGRMVDDGNAGSLCGTVAATLAGYETGWQHGITVVEIRTDTYDLRTYFATTDRTPVSEEVHHTCSVERSRA